MVHEAEDWLGVIIGVIDRLDDQQVAVTSVGPRARVEIMEMVLGLAVKGVRSALTQLNSLD